MPMSAKERKELAGAEAWVKRDPDSSLAREALRRVKARIKWRLSKADREARRLASQDLFKENIDTYRLPGSGLSRDKAD